MQNYFLNYSKQKEENLARHSRRLASRRLVPMLQVRQASRKLVRTLSAFSLLQRTIPATERKWKVIAANSSYGGALPTAVSKMVTRMVRHYDQDERQPDAAVQWETIRPVLLKAFAKQGARDFSDKIWLPLVYQGSSRFQYCEDSKNSLASFRAIQEHAGGITSAPELMEQILILYDWKEYIFSQGLFFQHPTYPGERNIPSGKESEDDRLFFTPLNPFGKIPMKKKPWWSHNSSKTALTQKLKRNQDAVYLGKIFPSTRSRIAILANEVTCNHRTQSCASRLHLQSNSLKTEIEYFSKDSQPLDPHQKWH